VNSGIQPLQNLAILRQVKAVEIVGTSTTSDAKEFSQHVIAKGLAAIEKLVSEYAPVSSGLYAAGTVSPSIADICLVPQVYNARRMGLDMSAYPTVCAICDRCEALPAFQAAAPQNQPDAKN
jgi:maleylacetoacetate isomerase